MNQADEHNGSLGLHDIIAAALAIGLAVFAAPSPALSADMDDYDWSFFWSQPSLGSRGADRPLHASGSDNVELGTTLKASAMWPPLAEMDPAAVRKASGFNQKIEVIPISVRSAPTPHEAAGPRKGVTIREDRWTMLDLDGVLRVSAYARGTLEAEDTSQLRIRTAFPRSLGTGVGFVTATPFYVGATMKTDRSIYDIDPNRFDGARWSTSVFMGTKTTFGPLYLGTTQDADGTRSAYLYIGRWF